MVCCFQLPLACKKNRVRTVLQVNFRAMKTKFLFLLLFAFSLPVFSQGRLTFVNDSTRPFVFNSIYMYPGHEAYDGEPVPANLPPPALNVALYAGTSAVSLNLQTTFSLTGSAMSGPGLLAPKALTLTGVFGGTSQFFQIFVWGPTFGFLPVTISSENQFRNSVNTFYFGTSGLFTFTPSTSAISAPAIHGGDSTWASGEVTIFGAPEPSGLTLLTVGALICRCFHRRRFPASREQAVASD